MFIYLKKDTPVHRLDARAKMLILFSTFVIASTFEHPFWILGVAGIVLVYGAVARSLENIGKIWFILVAIFIMSTILWSFFASGTERLFWIIDKQSVFQGIGAGIKIDTMILAGMIFLSTTKIEDIALGLVKIGIPHRVSFAFSSAIRLVPTFIGAGATISQAQKSRGLDLEEGSVIDKMKKYIPLLVPIFLSALRSTDQLAMALESKGFGARDERTYIQDMEYRTGDYLLSALFLLLVAAGIFLRLQGYGIIEGLQM